jgi:hypothetical protein
VRARTPTTHRGEPTRAALARQADSAGQENEGLGGEGDDPRRPRAGEGRVIPNSRNQRRRVLGVVPQRRASTRHDRRSVTYHRRRTASSGRLLRGPRARIGKPCRLNRRRRCASLRPTAVARSLVRSPATYRVCSCWTSLGGRRPGTSTPLSGPVGSDIADGILTHIGVQASTPRATPGTAAPRPTRSGRFVELNDPSHERCDPIDDDHVRVALGGTL